MRIYALSIFLSFVSCNEVTIYERQDLDASIDVTTEEEPDGDVCGPTVETVFKNRIGQYTAKCSACDHDCPEATDGCKSHGDCCLQDSAGHCYAVCQACCNATTAELRCIQLHY